MMYGVETFETMLTYCGTYDSTALEVSTVYMISVVFPLISPAPPPQFFGILSV